VKAQTMTIVMHTAWNGNAISRDMSSQQESSTDEATSASGSTRRREIFCCVRHLSAGHQGA